MSVTIKDIARIADVSIATVSKVINGKTHDISDATKIRIEKILKDENYVPNHLARSIRTNVTNTIGLIIPDIRNSFFTEVARGAEDESYEQGYSIFFANSDDKFEKELSHINAMVSKQVDGILIAGSTERDVPVELQMNISKPVLAIDRKINYNFLISTVTTNNEEGAYTAVCYLIDQGHEKILHLAGPQDNVVSIDRLNGYKKALEDNGLSYCEEDVLYGDFSTASGYERISGFKDIKNYTAVFASNDMIAFGVIGALNARQISIPDDISVIGVDNVEHSGLVYPALTTIDQSAYELGQIAAREMITHLSGKKIPEKTELIQNIVVRNSVIKKEVI